MNTKTTTLSKLVITGGTDRAKQPEAVRELTLLPGESLTVVGPTGSGKSELLADIEQMADADTPSGRHIRFFTAKEHATAGDGTLIDNAATGPLVATLSQRTNFIMDTTVAEFIRLHAASLNKAQCCADWPARVVALANTLCGEPMTGTSLLQRLSGGQTRALMIADIALISDAPVVLIDEVENAGIDKHLAVKTLAGHGKIIITATHDPVLMLSAGRRLIMGEGGMRRCIEIDDGELQCRARLSLLDDMLINARDLLRNGQRLNMEFFA